MQILGVDYGEARTGLARCDALGLYAVGMGCIKSYHIEQTAKEIAARAAEIGAERIVIGKPLNMNGTSGEKVARVGELARLIAESTSIPTELFDERLTTVSAHRILTETGMKAKKHRAVVDSLSAELILQGYMDRMKNI